MVMTEDEAKTKWCPMALARTYSGDPEESQVARCQGAACMAWRLDSDEKLAAAWDASGTGALPSIPDAESKRGGYCGLAGVPQ